MTERRATDAQVGFIRTLAHRVGLDLAKQTLADGYGLDDPSLLTVPQASAFIDTLKAAPPQAPAAPDETKSGALSIGIYRRDGQIVKVHESRTGPHLLASRLNPQDGTWTYLGAARRFVSPEHRMSLAEAEEYSLRINFCCACGRSLTAEESVRLGIGPICRTKYF